MRVLPHVVGAHREIPEAHVFEDIMQLVALGPRGHADRRHGRARPARDRHHRERLPRRRERRDAGAAHELRSGVTTALGIDVGMSGVRAAVVDEDGSLLGAGRAAPPRCG